MDVTVRGRNVDVPEALRAAAEDKVARLARFLDGIGQAEVHVVAAARTPPSRRHVDSQKAKQRSRSWK